MAMLRLRRRRACVPDNRTGQQLDSRIKIRWWISSFCQLWATLHWQDRPSLSSPSWTRVGLGWGRKIESQINNNAGPMNWMLTYIDVWLTTNVDLRSSIVKSHIKAPARYVCFRYRTPKFNSWNSLQGPSYMRHFINSFPGIIHTAGRVWKFDGNVGGFGALNDSNAFEFTMTFGVSACYQGRCRMAR
jgi:hypothetical protein